MDNNWRPIAGHELTMPWSGRRIRAVAQPCATCGASFLSPASQPRRYCSRACYHARPRADKTRGCEQCGVRFTAKGSAKYCSHACYAESRRGPRGERWKDQRMLTMKGHPITPPSGVVAYARVVLHDKIGPGEHPCHWCGRLVAWRFGLVDDALVADHLNWDRNDDRPANLVPSCVSCNAHRTSAGTRTLIAEGELTMLWSGIRTRAVCRACEFCGSAFLTIPAQVKIGKGRFCSRSCARRRPRQMGDPAPHAS